MNAINTWFNSNFASVDFDKYQNCSLWTKAGAISRFLDNDELHEVLYTEPLLFSVFKDVINLDNYNNYCRYETLLVYITRIYHLVGWYANNELLRTSKVYDLVRCAIVDLLPPDVTDLLEEAESDNFVPQHFADYSSFNDTYSTNNGIAMVSYNSDGMCTLNVTFLED